MKTNLTWKVVLILGVMLVFIYGILGVPKQFSGKGLQEAVTRRIHLGLDLKGGTHLILQVMVNEAIGTETDRAVERLKDSLKQNNISYAEISKPDPQNAPERIQIKGVPPEVSGELRRVIQDNYQEYDLVSGSDNSWTVTMKPNVEAEKKRQALEQAIETIRRRVDALGVTEPTIQEHGLGDYQILVQLPGVDDPARVKEIMQSTAMLEIRQAIAGPFSSKEAALQQYGGVLPVDAVLLPGTAGGENGGGGPQWYVLSRTAAVSGSDLRGADASRDENGRPDVVFHLTNDGGNRFYNFTSAHVGDKLAVVLDNRVQEVATIQEAIRDEGRITGRFTEQESRDLSMVLRSGALPASIRYLEERTVGPSLGADSIRKGVTAAIIGILAVMAFMLFYYHGAGINADLALFFNLVILLGFLGFSEATLTLPGIAGVILTVGMGVDSNVLIFERIREELRNGKTPASAVDQGFAHAWRTILDTHVTTIVSAAILFVFGTGPVKGFAVTLTFGLLANLFTAVFASRVLFDWNLSRKGRGEAISIG